MSNRVGPTARRWRCGWLAVDCPADHEDAVQNLLAGIATCGVCGGGLVVEQSNNKKGRYAYYICHRHRVQESCTNALRLPVEDMNEAVLAAIEAHALTGRPSSRLYG